MKWVALLIFLFWMVVYFYGGYNSPAIVVDPTQGPGLFFLGIVIMLTYIPLNWWRKQSDKKELAGAKV
jgi:uncharacterized membrane protein YdjX (TVP38/TMEM64 family)